MAAPRLNALPPSGLELAMAAILETLRDDPALAAAGVRVEAPDGSRKELEPRAPALGDMPCIRQGVQVRITGTWASEGQQRWAFRIPFYLYHVGFSYVDTTRMIQAFTAALWPTSDPARRDVVDARLRAADDFDLTGLVVESPADLVATIGDDDAATRAQLWLSGTIDLNT